MPKLTDLKVWLLVLASLEHWGTSIDLIQIFSALSKINAPAALLPGCSCHKWEAELQNVPLAKFQHGGVPLEIYAINNPVYPVACWALEPTGKKMRHGLCVGEDYLNHHITSRFLASPNPQNSRGHQLDLKSLELELSWEVCWRKWQLNWDENSRKWWMMVEGSGDLGWGMNPDQGNAEVQWCDRRLRKAEWLEQNGDAG